MKLSPPTVSTFATALALAVSGACAATEATTDPVGFITAPVSGGSAVSPKLSLVSPTLTRPIAWQGSAASVSSNTTGPTVISVANAPWSAGQFDGAGNAHYVEVVSATNSGALSDITVTTSGSITTSDNLSSFLQAGGTIRIRKHVTLADFLGATNAAGLRGGTSAASADEVLVYDGATPSTYWYYDGTLGGSAGWYDLNFVSSNNATIGPSDGVVIKRKVAGDLNITVAGAVKTGNTLFPIRPGLNVLGTLSAAGLTLANSGLINGNNGLRGSTSAATADEVTIYTPTSQNTYWYYDGSLGGSAGWFDLTFTPSDNTVIAPGSSFVVNRKMGGAFNWSLPAPNSF